MLQVSASSTNASACRRWRNVANLTFHNSVIQICPLVLDASFQFVDIGDLGVGTRWRRTFRAYNVRCLTANLTIFESVTASRVCSAIDSLKCTIKYSINSSMSLQISQGSAASIYFRHFMHSFVKCLFQDMPTNFYWNWFINDRHSAQKLACLLRHCVRVSC